MSQENSATMAMRLERAGLGFDAAAVIAAELEQVRVELDALRSALAAAALPDPAAVAAELHRLQEEAARTPAAQARRFVRERREESRRG